jgi:protein-arginine kinase activator protein McsA
MARKKQKLLKCIHCRGTIVVTLLKKDKPECLQILCGVCSKGTNLSEEQMNITSILKEWKWRSIRWKARPPKLPDLSIEEFCQSQTEINLFDGCHRSTNLIKVKRLVGLRIKTGMALPHSLPGLKAFRTSNEGANEGATQGDLPLLGEYDEPDSTDSETLETPHDPSQTTFHMPQLPVKKKRMCQECGKTFNRLDNLKRHAKTHELTRDKPFQCRQCGREFALRADRLRHENVGKLVSHAMQFYTTDDMQIHKPETPFQCERCGKSYKRNDNLQR